MVLSLSVYYRRYYKRSYRRLSRPIDTIIKRAYYSVMDIKEALKITGTENRAQLAYLLGISPMAIYKWDVKEIPWARALQVKEIVREREANCES
jgi:hypothetical protein